jgi:hypothetical protein
MCTDALEDEPECLPLLLIRARARIALRRDLDAQADLRDIIRLDPRCGVAYRLLGELAARVDENAAAAHFFQEALRIDPEDREAKDWLLILDATLRPAAGAAKLPASAPAAGRFPSTAPRFARGTEPPELPTERPTQPFRGNRERAATPRRTSAHVIARPPTQTPPGNTQARAWPAAPPSGTPAPPVMISTATETTVVAAPAYRPASTQAAAFPAQPVPTMPTHRATAHTVARPPTQPPPPPAPRPAMTYPAVSSPQPTPVTDPRLRAAPARPDAPPASPWPVEPTPVPTLMGHPPPQPPAKEAPRLTSRVSAMGVVPELPGFGEYLVANGILTRERLRAAQAYQRSMRVQLSTAIITLGLASPQRIQWAAIAHQSQLAPDTP